MQKLKNSILEKMIQHKLTSNEIDFLLYISRFQDEYGSVQGVHYKEVCEAMNISHQGFYNIKKSLEEKGFITCEKNHRIDHDIIIIDNSFHRGEKDWNEGYINTNQNLFYQDAFYQMKAGAKLLAMLLLRLCHLAKGKFRIRTWKFYDTYVECFGVSRRVMQGYLMELKKYFYVIVSNGMYHISPKKIIFEINLYHDTEAENYNRHSVGVMCRRKRIAMDDKAVKDTAVFFSQYEEYASAFYRNIFDLVNTAIHKSLETIAENRRRKKKKWKAKDRKLWPKLIHKELRKILTLD